MGKGNSSSGISKTSSGNRRNSRVMRNIMRAKMKINRWNRYKEEIATGTRQGKAERWDVAGLESYINHLEGLLYWQVLIK